MQSRISTQEINRIIEDLKMHQHRDSTRKNYYAVWKIFNQFFIHLDKKPNRWEDRLNLFVGHLISQNKQSTTVRCYILAIKAVLKMNNIQIKEDEYLLSVLTKACCLKNDKLRLRIPIQRQLLETILQGVKRLFNSQNQPYLAILYQALFISTYYGLLRVSKVMAGSHPILARDVHVAANKRKMLFILWSSKTHG